MERTCTIKDFFILNIFLNVTGEYKKIHLHYKWAILIRNLTGITLKFPTHRWNMKAESRLFKLTRILNEKYLKNHLTALLNLLATPRGALEGGILN